MKCSYGPYRNELEGGPLPSDSRVMYLADTSHLDQLRRLRQVRKVVVMFEQFASSTVGQLEENRAAAGH